MDGFNVQTAASRADHISICKFQSEDDSGYQTILGWILDFHENGKLIVQIPTSGDLETVRKKRIKCSRKARPR